MTKRKLKNPDDSLALALDAIGVEIERLHDLVERNVKLEPREREALNDYTKTLLTANNTKTKRLDDDQTIQPEEDIDTLAKEAAAYLQGKDQ